MAILFILSLLKFQAVVLMTFSLSDCDTCLIVCVIIHYLLSVVVLLKTLAMFKCQVLHSYRYDC